MKLNLPIRVRLTQFEGCREQSFQAHDAPVAEESRIETRFAGAEWTIRVVLSAAVGRPDAVDGCATFLVAGGSARSVAVALEWPVSPWSSDNFVMLYLEQIRETAHNLTQYLSRADRPVGDPAVMKPGWMCERVNFSDWEGRDNVGGNLFGSCWPEVSLMLTTVELPGIYVQPDTGFLCVFDHVDVRVEEAGGDKAVLQCSNPTAFDAEVRVFTERSSAAARILGQGAGLRWPVFTIPAGQTRRITIAAQLPR